MQSCNGGNKHNHFPIVTCLAIHLPKQHLVGFQDNSNFKKHLQRASISKLEAWFLLNKVDPK